MASIPILIVAYFIGLISAESFWDVSVFVGILSGVIYHRCQNTQGVVKHIGSIFLIALMAFGSVVYMFSLAWAVTMYTACCILYFLTRDRSKHCIKEILYWLDDQVKMYITHRSKVIPMHKNDYDNSDTVEAEWTEVE